MLQKVLHIVSEKARNDNALFIVSSLEKGKPEMYFLENNILNYQNKTTQTSHSKYIFKKFLETFCKMKCKITRCLFYDEDAHFRINVVNKLSVTARNWFSMHYHRYGHILMHVVEWAMRSLISIYKNIAFL